MIEILENLFQNTYSILGVLASAVGIYGIEAMFVPPSVRKRVSEKLKLLLNQNISLGQAIQISFGFFDKLFGAKHLSWRCFLTSAFATIVFTIVAFSLIAIFFSEYDFEYMASFLFYEENYKFLVLALLVNIIIDYLSLAETRFIVNRIKRETNIGGISIYLIVDAILTFLIFIIFFSLFKATLDFILMLPEYYSSDILAINHGQNITAILNSDESIVSNFIKYFISVIKYSLVSSWMIFEHGATEYWFSSLFLALPQSSYIIHTSTIWVTTHLSSIYIYFVVLFWVLKRLPLNNIRVPWFSPYNLNSSEYPLTVILINLILGLLFLLVIGYLLKYSGWTGLGLMLIFFFFFIKIKNQSLLKSAGRAKGLIYRE